MHSTEIVEGRVTNLRRMMNSQSGNPAWKVTIDQHDFRTSKDSQCGSLSISLIGKQVRATLSAGQITHLEELL